MAFTIKNIRGVEIETLTNALNQKLADSRFSARVVNHRKKITIHDIRLRTSKHYCGNHPLPCPFRGGHAPHKKAAYLEGADWVAFNDGLNDLLDGLRIEADIASSLVVVRKGRERCVEYDSYSRNEFNQWTKQGIYKDCIGQAHPRSVFPEGTPGIYQWSK